MKKYAKSHEWFDASTGGIGISEHAIEALGDVVYIELPEVGAELSQGDAFAVVESHKAASDIYAPVSGTVSAVNTDLADAPEGLNEDHDSWLVKIEPSDSAQADALMDEAAYKASLED